MKIYAKIFQLSRFRIESCIGRGWMQALSTALLALTCLPVHAGQDSWSEAKTSAGISRSGHDVSVSYAPAIGSPLAPGARIARVHASRTYQGPAQVQTKLCWNGVTQCVSLIGSSLITHAFDGLDASKPIYLVHSVPGKTALTPPLFVKGEVIIWFTP
jgi:hypothetical protein